jgi:hypothetical protein
VIGLILHKHSDGKYSRLGVFDIPSCEADGKKYPRMARGFLEGNPEEVTIIRLQDCVHIGEGRANDTGFPYVRFLVVLCRVRRIWLRESLLKSRLLQTEIIPVCVPHIYVLVRPRVLASHVSEFSLPEANADK